MDENNYDEPMDETATEGQDTSKPTSDKVRILSYEDDVKNKFTEMKGAKKMSLMQRIKNLPKIWKIIIPIALLLILGGVIFAVIMLGGEKKEEVEEDENTGVIAGELSLVKGDVQILKKDTEDWVDAEQGATIEEGDGLLTGSSSKAVINLDNGDTIRLDEDSEISLASLDSSDVVIEQVEGQSYSRVRKSEKNTYKVVSGDIEAKAVGTAYTFEVGDENINVMVLDSSVELNTSNNDTVEELSKAVIDADSKNAEISEITEEEFADEFISWNLSQDEDGGYGSYDKVGPQISVSEPEDGSETLESSVALKGTVTDDSGLRKIVVNDEIYTAKDDGGKGFDPQDGTFDIDITLNSGENQIVIVAYDVYWNKSNEVTVNITKTVEEEEEEQQQQTTKSFLITSITSPASGKILVKWSVAGYSAPNGFKVVYGANANPTLSGGKYVYASKSTDREATITSLTSGTYHVRVCIYVNGTCSTYTADKSITIEGVAVTYPTSITLSAGVPEFVTMSEEYFPGIEEQIEGYQVALIWTSDKVAPNGWKVCWSSTNNNPKLENGDSCIHWGSSNSYTVTGLSSNTTYYFSVGAYKVEGGGCQIYSNSVPVTTGEGGSL